MVGPYQHPLMLVDRTTLVPILKYVASMPPWQYMHEGRGYTMPLWLVCNSPILGGLHAIFYAIELKI